MPFLRLGLIVLVVLFSRTGLLTSTEGLQPLDDLRAHNSEEGIAPNTGHEQGINTLKTEHEQEIEKLKVTIESQSAIINANVVKHAEECEAVNNDWSGKYDRLKVEPNQEVEKLNATIGKTRQERENEELEEEDQETSRAEAKIQYDLVSTLFGKHIARFQCSDNR